MAEPRVTEVWPLTCKEAAERAGVRWACCDSCHDDADYSGEGLIFELNIGGAAAVVCCEMARAVKAHTEARHA